MNSIKVFYERQLKCSKKCFWKIRGFHTKICMISYNFHNSINDLIGFVIKWLFQDLITSQFVKNTIISREQITFDDSVVYNHSIEFVDISVDRF